MKRSLRHRPIGHKHRSSIGVSTGVAPALLRFGQRGDELAAEVGDVRDDAAPDRVRVAEKYQAASPMAFKGAPKGPLSTCCAHGGGPRRARRRGRSSPCNDTEGRP